MDNLSFSLDEVSTLKESHLELLLMELEKNNSIIVSTILLKSNIKDRLDEEEDLDILELIDDDEKFIKIKREIEYNLDSIVSDSLTHRLYDWISNTID
jgi:hypothetical protein